MKLSAKIALSAIAVASFSAMPAQAAVTALYTLDGTLANSLGGADITNNGGTLGANGITFGAGQGPSLGGFSNTGVYTIEVKFSFDTLSGYRRLLEFKNGTSDSGLYNLNSALNFYPVTTGAGGVFTVGQLARLVLTRDASGEVTGYVNGNFQISFADASGLAIINNTLQFFNDDNAVGGEQSSGFVDYIRIYDTALTSGEVAALTDPAAVNNAVPEPATWGMMILGFGLAGLGLRTRRITVARA